MTVDPGRTYVHLDADGAATIVPDSAGFWARPDAELDSLGRGWLISEFECAADWLNQINASARRPVRLPT